jgi:hypothetical protein
MHRVQGCPLNDRPRKINGNLDSIPVGDSTKAGRMNISIRQLRGGMLNISFGVQGRFQREHSGLELSLASPEYLAQRKT